jgi:hypothetical protein
VNIVEAGWRYIRTLPLIIKKKEFDPEAYYNDDSRSPEDRVHA